MLTFWPVVQGDTKVVALATVMTIVVLHTLLAIGCKVGEGAPRGGLVAVVHQLKKKLSSFLLLSCTSSRQQTLHWDPFPQPPQFTHRRPPYTNDHRNGVDLGSASESYIVRLCEDVGESRQQPPGELLGWDLVIHSWLYCDWSIFCAVVFQDSYCSMASFTLGDSLISSGHARKLIGTQKPASANVKPCDYSL